MFDLQPGNNVGGYTLVGRLGGGAMGSVWRVCDDGGNQYAMKILRASVNSSQNDDEDSEQFRARLRLQREALALQKIHHPGVCSIVDMELDASIAFIVTELIEGHNLREDVAENGPYVADDLERLTRKLIEAVRAVHDAGIIHRDIKPTNVMISTTGPVLVDFGIAMGEGESHVTRTGLVMGTPGFIAPEIIEGGDSDEITDWWSLSAVLAFAATGKPVFGTQPLMAVLERAASGNADLTGLPPQTMAAFRKALHPRREQRCLPSVLEQAISEDAMNPLVWPEVNHPFDCNATRANMRKLWRETMRETTCETVCETIPVTEQNFAYAYDTNDLHNADDIHDADDFQSSFATRVVNANINDNNDNTALSTIPMQSTAVMPQASHRIVQNTSASVPDSANDNDVDSADDVEYTNSETNANNANNIDNVNSSSQYAYLYRGRWVLAIGVIVFSAFAYVRVLDAVGLTLLMMLVSATAGYSASAAFRRQQLNNGVIPRHDAFVRVASLPWHIVRGFLYAISRIVIVIAVGFIGAAVFPLLCGNSPEWLIIQLGSLQIMLPTYAPSIFSQTAAGYAIGFLVAWTILAICKGTYMFCLGLGSLFGAKKL